VHQVERAQPALLAFDQEQGLAGQHQEVLLLVLAVVQA
jgi:hypothetical protein